MNNILQFCLWKVYGLVLFMCFLMTGCAENDGTETIAEKEKPLIVATVNGEPVTKDRVLAEFRNIRRKYRLRKDDSFTDEQLLLLRTQSLNKVIQEVLLNQEAGNMGISVNTDEFNAFRVQMMQGYQPETFRKSLEVVEIDEKEWEGQVRNRLLIKKLIDQTVNSKVEITDAELKEYFEQHHDEFQKGEQVRVLHILVDTEEEAREILKKLDKGSDFSDLAREHSQSLEGAEGGDMGYFEARHLPEEFEPIFKLKPGDISDIITTPYGFHVFKVVDKKPARDQDFEESRDEIHTRLLEVAQENAFNRWLKDILKRADIDIQYELLAQIN